MVKSDDVFITYKEVKRFSYWIWLIIAPISILMWVGAFTQIIMGKPFGSKPANDITDFRSEKAHSLRGGMIATSD